VGGDRDLPVTVGREVVLAGPGGVAMVDHVLAAFQQPADDLAARFVGQGRRPSAVSCYLT
jgi:hypothetical protein